MKSFLKTIYAVFESAGRARAAAYYSRMGNYEQARKIMAE